MFKKKTVLQLILDLKINFTSKNTTTWEGYLFSPFGDLQIKQYIIKLYIGVLYIANRSNNNNIIMNV